MAILTIDQIANADDLPTKVVPVEPWGGEVRIRMLTKNEQHQVRVNSIIDGVLDEEKLELGLLAAAIVEPDLSAEHIAILGQKNADVIDELLTEVFTMNALDKEAVARQRAEFHEGSDDVAGVPHSEGAPDDEAEASAGDAS